MSARIGRISTASSPLVSTLGVFRTPSANPIDAISPVRKIDPGDASRQDLEYGAVRVSISAEAQALNSAFRASADDPKREPPA